VSNPLRPFVIAYVKTLPEKERANACADAITNILERMADDLNLSACYLAQAVMTAVVQAQVENDHAPCAKAHLERILAALADAPTEARH
jgi:hypothetical protein